MHQKIPESTKLNKTGPNDPKYIQIGTKWTKMHYATRLNSYAHAWEVSLKWGRGGRHQLRDGYLDRKSTPSMRCRIFTNATTRGHFVPLSAFL